MAQEMTDDEVDVLLERFDQTDPKLQRRIIASFVSECETQRRIIGRLLSALKLAEPFVVNGAGFCGRKDGFALHDAVAAAIAAAEGR